MRLESDLENVFFHNMLLANFSCLKSMNIIINILGWANQRHFILLFITETFLSKRPIHTFQIGVPDSIFLRQIKRYFDNVRDPKHLVDPRGLNQWLPTTLNSTCLPV